MRRFRTNKKKHNLDIMIFFICISVFLIFNYYNKNISPKILNIAESKIEEYTNLYIKKDIVPNNIALDNLIQTYMNDNNEIVYLDINMEYANKIMVDVVNKIQNNIFNMQENDELFFTYRKNHYILVPVNLAQNGFLLSNVGPKVPIKILFYDHAFGNIDVKITEYGINNAMISVFLTIELEQKLYLPYKEEKNKKKFDLLIASKIINGKIPNIYGGMMNKSSNLIEMP